MNAPSLAKFAVFALVIFSALACDTSRAPTSVPRDVVLARGQSIRISNGNGTVLVAWDGVASRHFTFKGEEWTESMTVREYEWYGAWGVYSAGENFFDRTDEVGRIVYSEACKDFDSEEALKEDMDGEWNRVHIQYVWNPEGLVGGLHYMTGRRGQLSVDLWKITVRGQVPALFRDHACDGGTIEFVSK